MAKKKGLKAGTKAFDKQAKKIEQQLRALGYNR